MGAGAPQRAGERERLHRLLSRHTALRCHEDDGVECLYRAAEVLVPAAAAARADADLRRWTDRREDHPGAGVARFRLRPGAAEQVLDLAAGGVVSPNHVLRGEPAYSGGPADVPQVPDDVPAAPAAGPEAREAREAREVVVAVLDTGLDPHPWFTGQAWWRDDPDVAEVLDADLDYRLDAQAGHGTFVAGVVRQAAPSAQVLPVRVLSSDGLCDELALVEALSALHERTCGRVDVLNLSLGGYRFADSGGDLLRAGLARFGRDTAVVAAAGNNGSRRPFWPAALKGVVAVGALDATGQAPAAFSNRGPWVDAWAVGEGVVSAFVRFDGPAGDGARGVPDGIDPDAFDGYARWSGTSFAAPRVAGEVARRVAGGGSAGAVAWDLLHGQDVRPGLGAVVGVPAPDAAAGA